MILRYLGKVVLAALISLALKLQDDKVEGAPTTSPPPCRSEHYRHANGSCLPCIPCPKGQEPLHFCSLTQNTVCRPCPRGTWSNVSSTTIRCTVCTLAKRGCPVGKHIRYCTIESDTTCDYCGQDSFYYAAGDSCLWCDECSDRQVEVKPCTFDHDRICKSNTDAPTTATASPTPTPTLPPMPSSPRLTTPTPYVSSGTLWTTPTSLSEGTTNSAGTSFDYMTVVIAVSVTASFIFALVIMAIIWVPGCNPWQVRYLNEASLVSTLSKKSRKGLIHKMAITHVNTAVNPREESKDRVCAIWNLITGTNCDNQPCFQLFVDRPPRAADGERATDVAKRYLQFACQQCMTFEDLNYHLLKYELDDAAHFLRQQLPEQVRGNLATVNPAAESRPPVVNQETTPPGTSRGPVSSTECTEGCQPHKVEDLLTPSSNAHAANFSPSYLTANMLSMVQQGEELRQQRHNTPKKKGHVVQMPYRQGDRVDDDANLGSSAEISGATAFLPGYQIEQYQLEQTGHRYQEDPARLARVAANQPQQEAVPVTSPSPRSSTTSPVQEYGHQEQEIGEEGPHSGSELETPV